MDLFEKIDELHAKDVTPEEFKEVNGISKEEAMKNVMDFVKRFKKVQAERAVKKGKTARLRPVAERLAQAAVVLDPAARPAAVRKAGAKGKAAKAAAKPTDIAAKLAKALAAAGIVVPKGGNESLRSKILGQPKRPTFGEIIEVKLDDKDGVLTVTTKGLPGRVAAKKTEGIKFVEPVKGIGGFNISEIKIIEGEGLVRKGKGKAIIPEVMEVVEGPKGPKGPKGGGPKM